MTPANRRWVIAQARANKMAGYSAFMNRLVSALRTMGKVELETRPMRRRLVTKKRRKAA